MKDALIVFWRHGDRNSSDLEGYLEVKVSLCTRNARRRSLLHILASSTMRNYLGSSSFPWMTKSLENEYLRCLRSHRSFASFGKSRHGGAAEHW